MATGSSTAQSPAPGRIAFFDGQNEMPMLEASTAWSTAEVYLQGAHVTQFKKKDEHPLLFMSQCSRFAENQPIRGGIPVIFPWFGMREGLGQHGFARTSPWELKEFAPSADGSVSMRLALPELPEASTFPPMVADYVITLDQALTLQLTIKNVSADESLQFENCLHTYFCIGDIKTISIHGLKGVEYLDKVANFARKKETEDAIRISSEVDRIYLNTKGTVEIHDPTIGRKIVIEKQNSQSTVVWNPWIAKSEQMQDFGNDEYQRMVCVESGNVDANQIALGPGESSTLTVRISSQPLK